MIVQLPNTKTTPAIALALAAQETAPEDDVFIITVREDGEVWVRSSNYDHRNIHVAAAHLMAYSIGKVHGSEIKT